MRHLAGAPKSSAWYTLQNTLDNPIKQFENHATERTPPSDNEILGSFIKLLRTTAESYLGETVDLAVATHPTLPYLEQETLQEAFDSARMSPLRSYKALLASPLDSVHQVVSGLTELDMVFVRIGRIARFVRRKTRSCTGNKHLRYRSPTKR